MRDPPVKAKSAGQDEQVGSQRALVRCTPAAAPRDPRRSLTLARFVTILGACPKIGSKNPAALPRILAQCCGQSSIA
jgi:hypothetical protein